MSKRFFSIVVTFLLFLTSAFAQQQTASTQKNLTTELNDNVAVVTWVGYEGFSFDFTPELTKSLFCDSEGAFCTKTDNYFTIDTEASFPDEFASKFKEAVDKIKSKNNPILIISLSSHGLQGEIYRQTQAHIDYDKLLDVLFKNSFEVNKDIKLILFIEACYSGSVIPIIKSKLSCGKVKGSCSFEGTDGFYYKNKISVYTSGPASETTTAGVFLNVLSVVSKFKDCQDRETCGLNDEGILTFLSLGNQTQQLYWDSFSGKRKKSSLVADKNKSIKILDSSDSKIRKTAILSLSKYKNDKTVIKALASILKNDSDDSLRALAADMLSLVAEEGDKIAIEALNYALHNNTNKHVLVTTASSLFSIAQEGDKTTIEALLYVFEKNTQTTVRVYVVMALGKIAKGNKDVITVFRDAAKNEKDPYVNSAVVHYLELITKQ